MEKTALPLLAITDSWLVVDKPAGLLSIPGRDPAEPSALGLLREKHPEAMTVHRIDRETSGVLLFARSPDAHREANAWFEKHRSIKTYWALAAGSPFVPTLRISTPIEGAPALTQSTAIERFRGCFLAETRILTGRRHQIRIHLSGQGHPLLGDPAYGGAKEIALFPSSASGGGGAGAGADPVWLPIGRVALHAKTLVLPTGEAFEAPLPYDFSHWLKELRGHRDGRD